MGVVTLSCYNRCYEFSLVNQLGSPDLSLRYRPKMLALNPITRVLLFLGQPFPPEGLGAHFYNFLSALEWLVMESFESRWETIVIPIRSCRVALGSILFLIIEVFQIMHFHLRP